MESYLNRKESIILTAIEIIDELGIHELSSREIARRQEISEGTIFRHFKNKNEIILGVLDHFSKFDSDIINTIKARNLSFKEAVIYHFTSYAEYFENYPAITAIPFNYELLLYDEELGNKVKSIMYTRSNFIEYLIDQGKLNGELSDDINSKYLTDIITGFFRTVVLKWRISKYNFSLKDRVLATLDMILRAFMTNESNKKI
jgi:AcrR family transcriptional regulator